jgi:hypothetical protein
MLIFDGGAERMIVGHLSGCFPPEARIPDNGDCIATKGLLQSWYTGEIKKALTRLVQ